MMTPSQETAAKKWAFELAKEWLMGPPDRWDGHDLYRFDEWNLALSPTELGSVDYHSKPPPDTRVPVFGELLKSGFGWVYDDMKGKTLIEKARKGDPDSEAVLFEFAAEFIRRGCVLPENLGTFIADKLYERSAAKVRNRGRNKYANGRRDHYIQEAVSGLIKRGFSVTRNAATGSHSACSIISEALKRNGIDLSEHGVAKVWSNRRWLTAEVG